MSIVSALSNMGHEIRRVVIQKLIHLTSGVCWCTVLLQGVKVKLSPQVCESDRFGAFFCGHNGYNSNSLSSVNQMKFTIEAGLLFSNCQHQLRSAQVCTYGTLWRQHYITTSKEYLTNSHILSKWFELVFFWLHLVKLLCKLIIIWLNYEKKKKVPFLWNTA